jgi:hypothetical protein
VAGPLRAARAQDAAAWFTIAVALLLAPWARFWEVLQLAQPQPPAPFVIGGALLAALAVVHGARRGAGRRAVQAALIANLVAAAALAAWLLTDDPATGDLGTIVLVVTAASLLLQALFDRAMLHQHRA